MYSLSVGNSTKPVTLSTVIVNLFVSDVRENLLSKFNPIGPPFTTAPVDTIPLVGDGARSFIPATQPSKSLVF